MKKKNLTWQVFFYDIYVDVVIVVSFLIGSIFFYGLKNFMATVGFVVSIGAIVLWIIARIHLGKAFAVEPQAKTLITSGIYAKIRHPIYVSSFIALIGIGMIVQKYWFIVFLLVIAMIQCMRMQAEDILLHKKFGKLYIQYKNTTWI